MNTQEPLGRVLQVLFSPDLVVSSTCPFNPIHPFKSFIWLRKSSSAWQIKTVLSKIIYGSCGSLSFSLNSLCSIPINITHLVLVLCVVLKFACCCCPTLPKCSWIWWRVSKPISEIKLTCHLFDCRLVPSGKEWSVAHTTSAVFHLSAVSQLWWGTQCPYTQDLSVLPISLPAWHDIWWYLPPGCLWRASEPSMRSKFQGEGKEKERT